MLPAVLLVTHRVPYPPDKGDRIRTYHLLRHLSRRARVFLACLDDEEASPETTRTLEGLCADVAVVPAGGPARWLRALASLALGRTASEGLFSSPGLRRVVDEWASKVPFRSALASASSVAPYLMRPGLEGVPVVIDLVDADSEKWFDYATASRGPGAWLYRLEGRRLRGLEGGLADRTRALTVVSAAEADVLQGHCARGAVHVVPNGVDLDYFRPDHAPRSTLHAPRSECVFVGALDYRPNVDGVVWFCRDVWPRVRQRHPQARLRLVGRRPTPAVVRLGELAGVEVVGQVEDVRPHVAAAQVSVAPLRLGRGLQNKVLEALAMGKPVVSSPQALAGLPARVDAPARCAATVAEWVGHLDELFADAGLRRRLGEEGRRYAERHHDWERCLAPFDRLLGLHPGSKSQKGPRVEEPAALQS
jgi:sugar transferase (PEP-CTERM/EpsH1 system associated)